MIEVRKSEDRYKSEHDWLSSRFSFSFAQYHDTDNREFGPLVVFNEDFIQPNSGFGMHPHENMEIVTYVISGMLEHKDSMGNVGRIGQNGVQRMTAGTGVVHSEYNPSDDKVLHLLQIWFVPGEMNLKPFWEEGRFVLDAQRNRLLPIVSGKKTDGVLSINQDLTMYLSILEPDNKITYSHLPDRKIYVHVIDGDIVLNDDEILRTGDSARITDIERLDIATTSGAHLMLIEMP